MGTLRSGRESGMHLDNNDNGRGYRYFLNCTINDNGVELTRDGYDFTVGTHDERVDVLS